jgi:hypothetical protein
MTRDPETTRLRRYALGALSEEEHVAIEQQYFDDGDALDQLSIVEDELIEDYLEDRLDAEARDRFERHYLSTPGHRARVAVMRRLITTARAAHLGSPRKSRSPLATPTPTATATDRRPGPGAVTGQHPRERPREDEPGRNRHDHLPTATGTGTPTAAGTTTATGTATSTTTTRGTSTRWSVFQQAALAASIALVLGAGAVWLFNARHDDSRPNASTSPAAGPNGPNVPNGSTPSQPSSPIASSPSAPRSPSVPSTVPPSDSPRAPVVVSLSLSAIATRGSGADPAVTIPANADALLLRLETGPDDVPVRRGRAVLRTIEGDELWRGPVDTPRDANASVRALVRIPAARLRSGDLIVELHGTDAGDRESELARYMIRVTLARRPR